MSPRNPTPAALISVGSALSVRRIAIATLAAPFRMSQNSRAPSSTLSQSMPSMTRPMSSPSDVSAAWTPVSWSALVRRPVARVRAGRTPAETVSAASSTFAFSLATWNARPCWRSPICAAAVPADLPIALRASL